MALRLMAENYRLENQEVLVLVVIISDLQL